MSVETEIPVVKDDKYYQKEGHFFQVLFFAGMMHRLSIGPRTDWLPLVVIGRIGLALFLFCLFRIYVIKVWSEHSKKKTESLITTGVFKYTRHPMYTGLAMFAIRSWWPTEGGYTFGHALSFCITVIGVVMAGYYQEKETLARFGAEAQEYYRRTPRLFLFYPFMRR